MNQSVSRTGIPEGAPLGRLFAANALPAILSMLLTSGVVLVDGAFLGRIVGPEALAAVNLSLPLLYAFMGAALPVAVGFASPAALSLGAGDREEASRYFSAAVVTVILVCAVAAVLAWACLDPLTALLSRKSALADRLRDYLSIMIPGYLFTMLNITLSVFARSEGKPFDALVIGLVANAANVALDWLFIARLGWGTRGAAAATGIAAALGCAEGLARLRLGRSALGFRSPRLRPAEFFGSLANGISEMIGQYSVMLSSWLANVACLRVLGDSGLAALTVAGYISFVESMIVTGLGIGMAPIAGRSFGAGQSETSVAVFRLSARVGLIVGIVAFLTAGLGGRGAAGFWTGGDAAVIEAASRGFLLFGLGFLFNGFNALSSAWFTALCDAKRSGLIAALRGIVLPLLTITILPRLLGAGGFWLAMPATEFLTFLYAAPIVKAAESRLRHREGSGPSDPGREKRRFPAREG